MLASQTITRRARQLAAMPAAPTCPHLRRAANRAHNALYARAAAAPRQPVYLAIYTGGWRPNHARRTPAATYTRAAAYAVCGPYAAAVGV